MKTFSLSFLYVFSIVLAIGIGMAQVGNEGELRLRASETECPEIVEPPCAQFNPNCVSTWQRAARKNPDGQLPVVEIGTKMLFYHNALFCTNQNPTIPGCALPENKLYIESPKCNE